MNRLQAEDVQTFARLQTHTKEVSPLTDQQYIPRSDEAEGAQIQMLYGKYGMDAWGVGETLIEHDREFETKMRELGVWEPDL